MGEAVVPPGAGICYAVLPMIAPNMAIQLFLGLYLGGLALLVMTMAFLVPNYRPVVFFIGAGFFAVAVGLICGGVSARRIGRAARESRDDRLRRGGFLVSDEPKSQEPGTIRDEDVISWLIEKTKMPLNGSRWPRKTKPVEAFKHLCAELEANGLQLPRTIADERIKDRLGSITLTQDLLEPEYVAHVPRGMQGAASTSFCVLVCFSMTLIRHGYGWLGAVLIAIGAMGLIAALVHVRGRSLMLYALEPFSPIAGVGVVKDQRRRRWEVGDSILIVQAARDGRFVETTLFGPAGTLRWSFKNAQHPDFVALWQRWNHPLPRPELMD